MFTSSPNASMHCQRCFFHDRYPGAWAWDTCTHPSEGNTTQYILFNLSVSWKNLGAMTWLLGIWKPLVFCVCTYLLSWQVRARSFSGLPSAKHKQSRRFLESIDENFLIQEVEKPMTKVLHLMPTTNFWKVVVTRRVTWELEQSKYHPVKGQEGGSRHLQVNQPHLNLRSGKSITIQAGLVLTWIIAVWITRCLGD